VNKRSIINRTPADPTGSNGKFEEKKHLIAQATFYHNYIGRYCATSCPDIKPVDINTRHKND